MPMSTCSLIGLVILIKRLVLLVQKVQHRRVHHDIGRADRLRMLGKLDHRVHVLVGAGGDDARGLADLIDHDLHRALALGNRHREELALLAGDEHAVDAEIVHPVPQVAPEARLVDREVLRKRHQGGGPDALHMGAGIFLGFSFGIHHLSISTCFCGDGVSALLDSLMVRYCIHADNA